MANKGNATTKALAIVASLALVIGLIPAPAFSFADEPEASNPKPSYTTAIDGADQLSETSAATGGGTTSPTATGNSSTSTTGDESESQMSGAAADVSGLGAQATDTDTTPNSSAADATSATSANADDESGTTGEGAQASTDEGAMRPAEDPVAKSEDDNSTDGDSEGDGSTAFKQSQTVSGVTVTVAADAGAFPADAKLSVASASPSATEAAIAPEREASENVAASYTFDIKVLDKNGEELQPADGRSVQVSFATAEVADPNLDTHVYHVPDSASEAEELAVSESGGTATATSDGFSYYTVEFTYDNLQYVLPGGEEVALADVLNTVGLQGEPEAVEVSNPELFSASNETGEWVVASHEAFTSDEWMRVTIAGKPYEIAVTDGQYEVNGMLFDCDDNGTTATLVKFDNKSQNVEIPSEITFTDRIYEVTAIGDEAFEECDKLVSVRIPDTVTSIGDKAFDNCTSLKSAEIPDSVTSIGKDAFSSCTSLKTMKIPEGVTSIESGTFSDCESLESLLIPEGVTSIGWYSFYGCRSLETVTIPATVDSMDTNAFCECNALEHITINRNHVGDLKFGWGTFLVAKKSEAILSWTGSEHVEGMVVYSVTPNDAGYSIKGNRLKWNDDDNPAPITIRVELRQNESMPETRTATLTFDLGGGTLDGKTGTIIVEANVGDKINLPGAPTKDGYTFKYWKGSEYAAGAEYTVEGDHEFTAEWEQNAAVTHTVTFDANGHGTAPAAQTVEDGKTAAKPTDPKASGWTFGGWYTDKECTKAYDFSKPVTEDITLYAKWTKNGAAASGSGSTARTGDGSGMLIIALSALAVASLCIAALSARKRDARDI